MHTTYLLLFEIECLFHFRNSALVFQKATLAFAMLYVIALFRDAGIEGLCAGIHMALFQFPNL